MSKSGKTMDGNLKERADSLGGLSVQIWQWPGCGSEKTQHLEAREDMRKKYSKLRSSQ